MTRRSWPLQEAKLEVLAENKVKGIGGGVQIENGVFSDSENSSYVLSGTFYGIKKAFPVVAW